MVREPLNNRIRETDGVNAAFVGQCNMNVGISMRKNRKWNAGKDCRVQWNITSTEVRAETEKYDN